MSKAKQMPECARFLSVLDIPCNTERVVDITSLKNLLPTCTHILVRYLAAVTVASLLQLCNCMVWYDSWVLAASCCWSMQILCLYAKAK